MNNNINLKDIKLNSEIMRFIKMGMTHLEKKLINGKIILSPIYYIFKDTELVEEVTELSKIPSMYHVNLLKPLIDYHKANYVIMISEGSTIPKDQVPNNESEWQAFTKNYGNMHNHPNRIDIVNIIIYGKENSYYGTSNITKIKGNKRRISKFEWLEVSNTESSGKLTGFFNKETL